MEKEVKRVKMTVAYDGTNYKGWQVQPNGITIEEVLNRHLSSLLGEEIAVTGASRTDSGVHSLGNVAIFAGDTATITAVHVTKWGKMYDLHLAQQGNLNVFDSVIGEILESD